MPQPYIYSDGTSHGTIIIGEDGKPMGCVQVLDIHIDVDTLLVTVKGNRVVMRPVPDSETSFGMTEPVLEEVDGKMVPKTEEFTLEYVRLGLPVGYFLPSDHSFTPIRAPFIQSHPGVAHTPDEYISKHGGYVVTDVEAVLKSREVVADE